MIETHKTKANWHWDEPCYPLVKLENREAARIAGVLTVRQCHYCGIPWMGEFGQNFMEQHTQIAHPGLPTAYTVYPPTFGMEPKGRG